MDMLSRIAASRERAERWILTMSLPERGSGVYRASGAHDPQRYPGMLLPGSYDALYCLAILRSELFPAGDDAMAAARFLSSFQRGNGAFRPRGHEKAGCLLPQL